MQCTNPVRLMHLDKAVYPEGLLVPCGKCLSCRIAKRREWQLRMLHELACHDDAVFVTMTYDDNHLPENSSLSVSDLQKFFKRLRKELKKIGRSIRYYACGEYGDRFGRPHYHAIIYGLSLRPEDKMVIRAKWPMGLVHFGTAEPNSIGYVAQYIDKKFTGDMAKQEYDDKGRQPVFKVCSLGIGKDFMFDHATQLIEMGKCTVKGKYVSLPRYYVNKLDMDKEVFKALAKQKAAEDYADATGLELDPDVAYHVRPADEYTKYARKQAETRKQKDLNLKAKSSLRSRKM